MPPSTPIATASIAVNGSGPEYTFTVTVNDTGSTTVGTFWFSWVPGQDYMSAQPTSISSPAGWNAQVTTANYAGQTGYAIEWQASSAGSDLQSGGSSASFSFANTETPAQMAAGSPFDGKPRTATAVVYTGGALIGSGDARSHEYGPRGRSALAVGRHGAEAGGDPATPGGSGGRSCRNRR